MPSCPDYTRASRIQIKSPGLPYRTPNLPVSHTGHQISRSPIRNTKSPGLSYRTPNLPVSHTRHQISRSPIWNTKSPGLPYRTPNLPVSHTGHQISYTIGMKAHKIHFSDKFFFCRFFAILRGKCFDIFWHLFKGQSTVCIKIVVTPT